ncbi:2733_t:CDS:1 [Funneliformis geosporum]|uniref:ATP-dependent DNA helicase PIF1 n=1 Tax=Funneliformis geosporum TaxID=1117311 RepID=A0A9W4WTA5_9GLOM|nr:2733_t:CDS:1 [Funneliformis geosporum]CAI2177264.1 598_t:CDS:1 [Funneliformis geosporum]
MSYSSYFQDQGNLTMIDKASNDANPSLDETSSSYSKSDLAIFKASERSLMTRKTQRNTKVFRSAFQKFPATTPSIQKNTPIPSVQNNNNFTPSFQKSTPIPSVQNTSSFQNKSLTSNQKNTFQNNTSSFNNNQKNATTSSVQSNLPFQNNSSSENGMDKKQEHLKSENNSAVVSMQKRKGATYTFDGEWSDDDVWQPNSKKRYLESVVKNRDRGVLSEVNNNKETSSNHELSEEQQRIFDLVVLKRENIFFTGSAGTGKSFLLQRIISSLKARYGSESVAVTATTGIAAVNISGTTLHSFAGVGLGRGFASELVKQVQKSVAARTRWKSIDTLVIDEISMLDAQLFDKLEFIARTIRSNNRPFGGLQLVVTGDFFQLPPVSKDRSSKFCFDAERWKVCIKHTIQLTKIYRQKDSELIELLNEMRIGEMSDKSLVLLKQLENEPNYPDDGIRPTELYPINDMVNRANATELGKISHKLYTYTSVDWEPLRFGQLQTLCKSCLAPEKLELKRNAQVMLIKNLSKDLVNGSRGVVVGFYNQADGTSYYNGEDEAMADVKLLPIVRFTHLCEMVIQEAEWKLTSPGDVVLASRKQIPLVLSWAISIHKSQGQTLDRVKVDLSKVFEKGQAYVALSRATSANSLQVTGFRRDKVMYHERVKKFYQSLTTI